jgi:hypothetical protein
MGLFDDFGKNGVTGLAIGLGAAVVAPVVVPLLSSIAKPLAKGAIKGGLLLYEKGREIAAETGEVLEDLMVEARAELSETGNGGRAEEGGGEEAGAAEADGRRGKARKLKDRVA